MKLFCYGTLCDEKVQLKEFKTTFKFNPYMDFIKGWDISKVKINGTFYKTLIKSKPTSIISGKIIEVPEHLIEKVDFYETKAYKRIKIKTMLGESCQIYVSCKV